MLRTQPLEQTQSFVLVLLSFYRVSNKQNEINIHDGVDIKHVCIILQKGLKIFVLL